MVLSIVKFTGIMKQSGKFGAEKVSAFFRRQTYGVRRDAFKMSHQCIGHTNVPAIEGLLLSDISAEFTTDRRQSGTEGGSNAALWDIPVDPDKFFDTALVGYNFKSAPEIKEAIARAAGQGIGIIAMKTQAGGYKTDALGPLSPHQAALKWALQDTNVTAAIPGMKDMKMLDEDMSVMGMRLTAADTRILERYSQAVEGYYCHLCAVCEPTCPENVAISVVNRCLMYAESYGSMELARSTYREIPAGATASACLGCEECVAQCVNGVNISSKMRKARQYFV